LEIVEAGSNAFAFVKGTLKTSGKFIVTALDPSSERVVQKSFHKPEVKHIYFSHKIGSLNDEEPLTTSENATLIIVSSNYILNYYPEENNPVTEFDSEVEFSIKVDEVSLIENGFSKDDKDKVKMYYYNDSTLTWYGYDDICANLDTVTIKTKIPGSYALGILISPEDDTDPPEINEITPDEESAVSPFPLIKAKIVDQINGSGVNVSQCKLILDGNELNSSWNPTENQLYFQVSDSLINGSHTLQIIGVDNNGNSKTVDVSFSVLATDIKIINPISLEVKQNYPNPFNSSTLIKYIIPEEGFVEVNIYNESGMYVKSIWQGIQSSGKNIVRWDGTNSNGELVSSGIYFYQIIYNQYNIVKQMILLR